MRSVRPTSHINIPGLSHPHSLVSHLVAVGAILSTYCISQQKLVSATTTGLSRHVLLAPKPLARVSVSIMRIRREGMSTIDISIV